mmetsp:Transcript_14487/g.43791  ORF Transcript_14487/g.43791 Transcript_14487/m.43791 type:complete len:392 (-) Transcript_14487:343-1518(-)|eukprot:CAMPEP_0206138382 /NCGR_PEP_ID=MMETSP1473-20131121/3283_1 /ASSEMBLY_ACC=CAM_ASM_001109 /TAXON_ID=1461547 /ORGANISM="Stichococcus sp, Strain RCC1054" /LENGTH=391 /DNA_ID=CAMNT_0053531803 /DNA_START=113 /DNA_END=1288 /DNA_ORIENTATION=+
MARPKKGDGEIASTGKRQKKSRSEAENQTLAAPDGLSERMQQRHNYVTCGADVNVHTGTMTSAHAYMSLDVDNSWSFDHFARNFSINLNEQKADEIEFDVQGVDPAIMNCLRRILISEVPTVAIEHVFILDNTSIIADGMFAHRLGLIPINLDPRKLDWRDANSPATERNTVVLKLHVDCTRKADGSINHEKVLSQDLQYLSGGSEIPEETQCTFSEDQREALGLTEDIAAVLPDILLAKMRPGQSIELEAHCTKGIGAEHAKWSPVATAWYRLEPEMVLLKDVEGEKAEELLELCRPQEGEVQPPLFRLEGEGRDKKLAVVKTRGNEHHLEKVRRLSGEPEWEDILRVRKHKERFIFTIQSTGQLPPPVLFTEAIDVLEAKCDKLLENLQ